MRKYIISELFFKNIAEKGKLYSRLWMYWLGGFVDELFEPDFIEKQKEALGKTREIKQSEIIEIYHFGLQLLQQDFNIIEDKKSKPKKAITKEQKKIASQVIEYLNSKAETTYTTDKGSNLELIVSRLEEGFTISDFKQVIDKKTKDWKGTDWNKYLRPVTLFSKSKFENYLNSNYDESKPTNNFTRVLSEKFHQQIIKDNTWFYRSFYPEVLQ